MIDAFTKQLSEVFASTNKYLDEWRKYDRTNGLWNPKRKIQIEKTVPTCANLDSLMKYYQDIKIAAEKESADKTINFLSFDMTLVVLGVVKQAEIWRNDYGDVLLNSSRSMLNNLLDRLNTLEGHIAAETTDLEALKFVLNVITDIINMTLDIELEILDINERYRTITRYSINVPSEELTNAMTIEEKWKKIYVDSRTRDLRLVDTKEKFRVVTANQDVEFRESLQLLRKEFLDAGPGISSVTLDDGVELMGQYKRRIAKLNKEKAELINAQNLFNLDVKPYPLLQQTIEEMDQLDKIYGLYIQFKEFQDNFASMLWGDLDIAALQKGADDFEKEARKFPKYLKEIYTFLNKFKLPYAPTWGAIDLFDSNDLKNIGLHQNKTYSIYYPEIDEKIVGAYVLKANQVDRGSHVGNASYIVDENARGMGVGKALALHSIASAKEIYQSSLDFGIF
jgi:dynein heavy chain